MDDQPSYDNMRRSDLEDVPPFELTPEGHNGLLVLFILRTPHHTSQIAEITRENPDSIGVSIKRISDELKAGKISLFEFELLEVGKT